MKKNCFTLLLLFFTVLSFSAPYNGGIMDFKQPDGTIIKVKLYGDEYYMRAEGIDGYTVIRDEKTGWICYAKLSDDGTQLVSTGKVYGSYTAGLSKHIELTEANKLTIIAKTKQVLLGDKAKLKNPWEKTSTLKSTAPKSIRGNYKGLCILVDFSDAPAAISTGTMNDFCNGDNFSFNGNNGSVKKYFQDVSGGLVTYENVVYGYFRAPKTFAQYDAMPFASGAQEILGLALQWIDNQGFNFSTLSIDNGTIKCINLMYTGVAKNWSQGMWWHASSYSNFTADGVRSGPYNCSPVNSDLSIGTVIHENGHMLCGWPDTYKYNSNTGPDGIGSFDVMCGVGPGNNPVLPNPYFCIQSSWYNVQDVTNTSGIINDASNSSTVYQYKNNADEYFIIKARQKTGRSAGLPDEGLTIWHINRAGDNQTTNHEVYLEHANNDINNHADACWHAGQYTTFNDNTAPNAHWVNGGNSNLKIANVSGVGGSMTYQIGNNSNSVGPVTFYKDCSFGGPAVNIGVGDYNMATMNSKGILDDDISSIKIPSGYKVILYWDDNFTGSSLTLTGNDDCLVDNGWNDKATSFRVRPNGVGGLNGVFSLQNRNSGMFMDVAENGNPADGTNILQWTGTGGQNQQFTFTDLGDGAYKLICVKTGKAVDVAGINYDNFANIAQWTYLGSDNQKFIPIATDNGYYKLKAVHSGRIIEVGYAGVNAGDNINQYDDNNQTGGQWKLIPVTSTWSTKIEAENYSSMLNVATEACTEGTLNVGWIDAGDWMAYSNITIPSTGTYTIQYRVASPSGGTLSSDLNTGSIQLGNVTIPATNA